MTKLEVTVLLAILVFGSSMPRAGATTNRESASHRPAQASGAPFPVTEFNLCSLNCSDGTIPASASYTNFGMNPVDEFLDRVAVRDWPRVIALNEVCSQAAFVATASLPAGLYHASYYVSARRPDQGCDTYGNWVAVRTGDVPASQASTFHFFWGAGTPPPNDTTSENRGGACARSFIFFEQLWGCSTHLSSTGSTAEAQANGLRSDANAWFGTAAQVVMGDFNLIPSTTPMVGWDTARNDVFANLPVTYQQDANHIDYGWAHQTALTIPASATAYGSSSDHHQLWGTLAFN